MKKFLLVLSCCLATWCSVLAGPKSSPEISLMQASAPAAAPAKINEATYDSNTRKVKVKFTVNSGSKVSFNLAATGKITAEDVFTKQVKKYGIDSVFFAIPTDWKVANAVVIKVDGAPCGGASLNQQVIIEPEPDPVGGSLGDIYDVRLSNDIGEDKLPKSISFDYNLKETKNPYIWIKKGDNPSKGSVVAKIKIKNTDGLTNTINYSNYSDDFLNALVSNTDYSACLYDGTNDLGIYYNFKMPLRVVPNYNYYFDWYRTSNNEFVIMPSQNIPSYFEKIKIWVYKTKNPVAGCYWSYHWSGTVDARQNYTVRVQSGTSFYYHIIVEWPNGERYDRMVPIYAK